MRSFLICVTFRKIENLASSLKISTEAANYGNISRIKNYDIFISF